MKPIENLETIVSDYLYGRLSGRGRQEFLRLIRESKDSRVLSKVHDSIFEQIDSLSPAELDRLHQLMRTEQYSLTSWRWTRLFPYAAALLLLGFTWYAIRTAQVPPIVYDTAQTMTYMSKPHTVTLSDGSVLDLERNARIDQVNITANKRELTLYGKASFRIKSSPTPFKIYTANGYSTEVLGTQFSIDSEPNRFDLYVSKGRVKVLNKDKLVGIFQRGDYLTVQDNHLDMNSSVVEGLDFDGAYLKDIVKELNTHYDASIELDKAVNAQAKIKISFAKELTLVDALTLLCEVNGLNYAYEDKGIVIRDKFRDKYK